MDRYGWDFIIVVYRSIDEISHYYLGYMDPKHVYYYSENAGKFRNAIRECYEEIDRIIDMMLMAAFEFPMYKEN